MRWPWTRIPQVETRSDPVWSIGDPVLAGYFGAIPTYSGVTVNENSSLGISAVWRACSLISGTIASLPMKTYRDIDSETRQQVSSFLDDPGTEDGPTPFQWKETLILHLLLHGRAYLAHVHNGAGALIGLIPVHPLSVTVDPPKTFPYTKVFRVALIDGTNKEYTPANMTEILGLSLDGFTGLSVIAVARNSLGTTIAGDRAAARMFSNGAMISGLVTPDEDVSPDEAKKIKEGLDNKLKGWENAGDVAFVNRRLTFTPWTMSAEDAQFLESRQFQIEEIARWFGIPPFELMQTEKQTSWGTGIEAQQRGLARGTLNPWTVRIEECLSRLLPAPRFVEFDFSGLERPTPEQEIDLLIKQVQAGIITANEARKIRNMPPLPDGNSLRESPLSIEGSSELLEIEA